MRFGYDVPRVNYVWLAAGHGPFTANWLLRAEWLRRTHERARDDAARFEIKRVVRALAQGRAP